jgi:hypothetical protein
MPEVLALTSWVVTLRWDPIDDPATRRVELLRDGPDGHRTVTVFHPEAGVMGGFLCSWADVTGVEWFATYRYFLRAYDAAGRFADGASVEVRIPPPPPMPRLPDTGCVLEDLAGPDVCHSAAGTHGRVVGPRSAGCVLPLP